MPTALLLIDFINEITHPEGKLAKKGYADFIATRQVLANLSKAINEARTQNLPIIHVKIGFSSDYREQPKTSPLFSQVAEFQALKLDTWATEFHSAIDVQPQDFQIIKHRVSAFQGTSLDLVLKNIGVNSLIIAGVATDLAVSSTAREAHDRDYQVTILANCCAAANDQDHQETIHSLAKLAEIKY